SQLGKGTCFSFSINLDMPAAGAGEVVAGDGVRPLEVLIVDDNELARDTLCSMSRANGWTVQTASSGEAALALIARTVQAGGRFDAMFMDWHMPGLDGWEAARRIRASSLQDPPTLLIMVTAHGRELNANMELLENGLLDGYLLKPVTRSMLADAVNMDRNNQQGTASSPRIASGQTLRGLSILLVEDNENNQQVACELLADEGARVSVAANGQIAVDTLAADSTTFDIVLMDLQMPIMDGFAATRYIRQNLRLAHLPVIAMTANAMNSDREACLQAGMNDHVGKPFDLSQLISVIRLHTRSTFATTAADLPNSIAREDGSLPAAALRTAQKEGVEMVQAVQRLGGSHKAYTRFLQRFLDDYPKQLSLLKTALEERDFKTGARIAHTLKGLAATLGIQALVDRCLQAEKALAAAWDAGDGASDPVQELLGFSLCGLGALLQSLQNVGEVSSTPSTHPLKGFTMMVVDDSEIQLELIASLLMRLGAVVVQVDTGEEALSLLAESNMRCDAVLMDVQMPNMDGLATTRHIRTTLGQGSLPVVGLSAGDLPEERELALAAGMNDFIVKPVDIQTLQRTLSDQLGLVRALASAAPDRDASKSATKPGTTHTTTPDSPWASQHCLDHVAALERLGGDTDLLLRTLRRMLGEFGTLPDEVTPTALDTSGRKDLASRMHKLKGVAGMIEARAVHTLAHDLEHLLRGEGSETAIAQKWQSLASALTELEQATHSLRDHPALDAPADGNCLPLDDYQLAAFRELLLNEDLDALTFFSTYQVALNQRLGAETSQRIAQLLDSLGFDEAAELVPEGLDAA
ncbi:MAG: response regulator, partial [Hydrogenophaga sp.]